MSTPRVEGFRRSRPAGNVVHPWTVPELPLPWRGRIVPDPRTGTAPGAWTAFSQTVRQFFTYLCSSGLTVSATKMSPFGAMVM